MTDQLDGARERITELRDEYRKDDAQSFYDTVVCTHITELSDIAIEDIKRAAGAAGVDLT